MVVEDHSGGFVIVCVVHTTADGGVVISEDGKFCEIADGVAAFIGLGAVTDDVSEAKIFIARMLIVEGSNDFEGVVIAVNI